MKHDYTKERPESDDEKAVFNTAFSKSKAGDAKARMHDAQKALYNYRKGLSKAVDDSLGSKISKRKQKIDEASGY